MNQKIDKLIAEYKSVIDDHDILIANRQENRRLERHSTQSCHETRLTSEIKSLNAVRQKLVQVIVDLESIQD